MRVWIPLSCRYGAHEQCCVNYLKNCMITHDILLGVTEQTDNKLKLLLRQRTSRPPKCRSNGGLLGLVTVM